MLDTWKNADAVERVLLVVVVALLALTFVIVLDMIIAEPYTLKGKVVGMEYTPSSSNVGTGFNSNGDVVVLSTYEGEKWALILDVDGDIQSHSVSAEVFYSVELHDYVGLSCAKGKLIGSIHC